jgi:hypothetical protein
MFHKTENSNSYVSTLNLSLVCLIPTIISPAGQLRPFFLIFSKIVPIELFLKIEKTFIT